MSQVSRRVFLTAFGVLSLIFAGCSHPAERALEGEWYGKSVENFDAEEVAAATGWARGTSFVFKGNRVKVTVPAEKPRSGVFRLSAIEDRQVSLVVLDSQGEESELDLIVDDAESLRWLLGEGRAVVLRRAE
jgi:hypothetical protein